MKPELWRVEGKNFVAGFEWPSGRTAPILRKLMDGKDLRERWELCWSRGWRVTIIDA